ncbi:MAG TPA: hypothetical protein VF037_04625, partial [Gemmatimonadales bacterium]
VLPVLLRPPERTARHLAAWASASWLGMLAFTGWAVQPAPAPAAAFVRVAPAVPHLDRFAGRVSEVRLDGAPTRGRTSAPILAEALERRSVRLDADATVRTWTDQFAPIADVVDAGWNPTLQLGQVGQKIVFSVRARSEALRLRAPSVKVYRALPPPEGQPIEAGGALEGMALSAYAIADGVEHRARTRLTPGLGWMLVLPLGFYPFDYRPDLTSAAWTALPLLLVGFWARRSGAAPFVVPGMAIVLALGLLAIPPLTGAGREGWVAWIACALALVGGWISARYASTVTVAEVPPSARSASSP